MVSVCLIKKFLSSELCKMTVKCRNPILPQNPISLKGEKWEYSSHPKPIFDIKKSSILLFYKINVVFRTLLMNQKFVSLYPFFTPQCISCDISILLENLQTPFYVCILKVLYFYLISQFEEYQTMIFYTSFLTAYLCVL